MCFDTNWFKLRATAMKLSIFQCLKLEKCVKVILEFPCIHIWVCKNDEKKLTETHSFHCVLRDNQRSYIIRPLESRSDFAGKINDMKPPISVLVQLNKTAEESFNTNDATTIVVQGIPC